MVQCNQNALPEVFEYFQGSCPSLSEATSCYKSRIDQLQTSMANSYPVIHNNITASPPTSIHRDRINTLQVSHINRQPTASLLRRRVNSSLRSQRPREARFPRRSRVRHLGPSGKRIQPCGAGGARHIGWLWVNVWDRNIIRKVPWRKHAQAAKNGECSAGRLAEGLAWMSAEDEGAMMRSGANLRKALGTETSGQSRLCTASQSAGHEQTVQSGA